MYVPVIIAILLSYFLSEATGWISLKLDIGNSVTDIASPPELLEQLYQSPAPSCGSFVKKKAFWLARKNGGHHKNSV